MKIIKSGKIPPPLPPKTFRGKCYNCNGVVEYSEAELNEELNEESKYSRCKIAECPTYGCHNLLRVYAKKPWFTWFKKD